MKRRIGFGLVLVVLFTLGNIAGGVYAASMREMNHAALHFALTLVGAWITWRIVARRREAVAALHPGAPAGVRPGELASRLTNLEQSLDAIAVEVERVGEGQRFMTKVFTERDREPDER